MKGEEEVESLFEVLKYEKDPAVRAKVVDTLSKRGEAALEPLIRALTDAHWDVRRKAAWALGYIGDLRAVEPLIHALTDDHRGVREQAAWALGHMKDLRAIEPLINAFTDDYSDVRCEAARSLALLTVLSEEMVKETMDGYESNLEAHARDAFHQCKELYGQELKKLR